MNKTGSTVLQSNSIPLGELPSPAPRACCGRGELIEKVVGLAENLEPIALIGAGRGIGKTSIALTVLRHNRTKERFGDDSSIVVGQRNCTRSRDPRNSAGLVNIRSPAGELWNSNYATAGNSFLEPLEIERNAKGNFMRSMQTSETFGMGHLLTAIALNRGSARQTTSSEITFLLNDENQVPATEGIR